MNRNESDTERHLSAIESIVDRLNPKLAMFYRLTKTELVPPAKQKNQNEPITEISTCLYCGSSLGPGNHSIRLLPRRPFTPKVCRLMQKYAENPRSLGYYQQKMVNDFKTSQNKLKITCFTCKKSWKIMCQSSSERMKQRKELKPEMPVEEKGKTKKEKKKEKKKALKKKKQLQIPDEVVNAGLKIVKSRDGLKQNTVPVSGESLESRLTLQHDHKESIPQKEVDVTTKPENTTKQKSQSKSELLEKLHHVEQSSMTFKEKSFKERKKHRFASQLSGMLKREKAKDNSNDSKNTGKTNLQAFLTSL